MLANLILKIRRRENPFYTKLYWFLKKLNNFNVPSIRWIHLPMYYTYGSIISALHWLMEHFFWVPMFKARLNRCGTGLRLHNGMPLIEGDNLVIEVGDNVQFSNNTLGGKTVFKSPRLVIGSGSRLGHESNISVAKEVIIGENTGTGSFTYIADNNGHPIDPNRRMDTLREDEVAPVRIGNNVLICYAAVILKGTTIGDNSIVAANTVVSGLNVPPNSLVYGSPPKIRPLKW